MYFLKFHNCPFVCFELRFSVSVLSVSTFIFCRSNQTIDQNWRVQLPAKSKKAGAINNPTEPETQSSWAYTLRVVSRVLSKAPSATVSWEVLHHNVWYFITLFIIKSGTPVKFNLHTLNLCSKFSCDLRMDLLFSHQLFFHKILKLLVQSQSLQGFGSNIKKTFCFESMQIGCVYM